MDNFRTMSELTSQESMTLIVLLVGLILSVTFAFKFAGRIAHKIRQYLERKYNVKIVPGMDIAAYMPDGTYAIDVKVKGEVSKSTKKWIAIQYLLFTILVVLLPLIIWGVVVAVFHEKLSFLSQVRF